jgi:photosystem II stability/assembly factor-like uncharacterized protein
MGMPEGGIWKTTSAGQTWFPVFDSIKEIAAVGSIAVAPSDPNVIYAGSGDFATSSIDEGNGVYKSTDAGATWQHLGLEETKQIPAVVIDPKDPNVVLIAAQGNLHTHTEQRGVFRSTDGGRTWAKTLYIDNETGGQDLAMSYDHPEVILATTVKHYNAPGAPAAFGFGGPQANTGPTSTKLFKSTDEGQTWKEISGNGLPRLVGRSTVAIANNTNAQRMFIIGTFGLYRSDDGGANWRQMASRDRRIANGQGNYTSGVFVDPKNPDIVYTLATSSYRSLDGGETFTGFKGAPGGDDPQRMWIDPTDGRRIFLGGDQGGTVSLDAGATWGSWYNQPTAQLYHISTDNQWPYWVYGTQQDSGSIATSTRGNLGQITPFDWLPHPGYEFGAVVADPLNPKVSYAGGPGAGIVKVTYPSGQWVNVSPNLDSTAGYRKVGNQQLAFNPRNPHELVTAFQFVMSTTDGGLHWRKLSPDLTVRSGDAAPKPTTPPATGPDRQNAATPEEEEGDEAQGGRPFNAAIESFSFSTVSPGVIWVGTNNGLVKVTKDGGRTWQDASIPGLPNAARADISTIDASHTNAGSAYVAVDEHQLGDYTPYVFRTKDYGRTWTRIVDGLPTDQPSGSFARVVRADTQRDGLLFCGTESGVYVSFDDGGKWQSLMNNLPNTSYRDLVIHGNDLVAGTYGRSIWVLDDYSPLRQMAASQAAEAAHLYQPAEAIRVRRNVNGDTPFPPEVPHAPNPPLGAVIYYSLAQKPQRTVRMEISDDHGNVVRHFSSDPITPYDEPPPRAPDFWLQKRLPLPTNVGLNRMNWNIRRDEPPAFTHDISDVMGAVQEDTPPGPEGALEVPGVYTATLFVDGKSYSQKFVVKNDPRSPASIADLRAQHAVQLEATSGIQQSWNGYQQVAALRRKVANIIDSEPPDALGKAASDFDAKLAAIGGTQNRGRGFGGFGGPPPAPTFVRVCTSLTNILETLDFGDMAPSQPLLNGCKHDMADLKDLQAKWQKVVTTDLPAFNQTLAKFDVKPLAVK